MISPASGTDQVKNGRCKCSHCGLPVPKGLFNQDRAEQFCCRGCETAYQLIHENGLEAFYSMSDQAPRAQNESKDRTFEEFDVPGFIESFGVQHEDGSCEIRFVLEGIHCAACIWLLEKLPQIVPGVLEARIIWSKYLATIRWNPQEVQLSSVASRLAQLGYTPHVSRANQQEETVRNENRKHLIRLAVAGAAAGNNMLIAAALYFGMFQTMTDSVELLLRWASCFVGVASLLIPGRIFFRGAIAAIRTRTPHMDLPVALGLAIGGLAGVWNTITNTGEIYFDSLSALVFLLLLGRWIQYRQQLHAADAIDLLHQVTPQMALRKRDDRFVPTPLNLIEPGDIVLVRSGETIPVDGPIVSGCSAIDESILTGESIPRLAREGQHVFAGALNLKDAIEIKSEQTQGQTRIGKLFDLVQQSSAEKAPIVQLADRIGGWFVAIVISVALIALIAWLFIDPSQAFDRCVSLLIVACPCALALATPLAISVALGRAAKAGILIKSGDALQTLNKPGEIWLDKTGTLTQGRMRVVGWETINSSRSDDYLAYVRAIESSSSHPVAVAIASYLAEQNLDIPKSQLEQIEQSPSGGIRARYENHEIRIGNRSYVSEVASMTSHIQKSEAEMIEKGASPVFVAFDHEVVAIIGVGDPLRSDSIVAVNRIREMGWEVGILSGDHQSIVDQVGQSLSIPADRCHGGMMPEQKMDFVRSALRGGKTVVMVGDGINDSAALAVASVGIAAHGGAQASLQAAPVYLGNAGLLGIVQLFEGGKRTMVSIRRNFIASLSYNLVTVTLAALGFINPLVAAVLMPISSLTVVGLSLASRSFQRNHSDSQTDAFDESPVSTSVRSQRDHKELVEVTS